MTDHSERRALERRDYQIPVEISFVRRGETISAQSLNHSEGGMCIATTTAFHPGMTLSVRVKAFHPHGPCQGRCEGLRSITLADVRWCAETTTADGPSYRLGVQFVAPVY